MSANCDVESGALASPLSLKSHHKLRRRQNSIVFLFVFVRMYVLVALYGAVFVLVMNMHHVFAIIAAVFSALDVTMCTGSSVVRIEHPTVGAASLLTFAMLVTLLAMNDTLRRMNGFHVVALLISGTLSILRVVQMFYIVAKESGSNDAFNNTV